MPNITKVEAEDIAKKLLADIRHGRKHDIAAVSYNGKEIAHFGIQRGKRDKNHNYIASQLFITRRAAIDLAICDMTHQDWIEAAKESGLIDEPDVE